MDYLKYLKAAQVPEELHLQALDSLEASRKLSRKLLPYKLAAPFVVAWLVQRLPWEAEALPQKWWKFDNEISINGDHHRGEDGQRAPAPLEDTPEIRAACYYAKGHNPRSKWARWVWLGTRNRASEYAESLGPVVDKPGIRYFGDVKTNNGHEGVVVWEVGGVWQIYSIRRVAIWGRDLCIRRNVGFKISNVFKHDAPRAMAVWIPFSAQGWDEPKP